MGANLKFEGMKDVLKKIGPTEIKPKEPTVKEVNNNWKKLASFMRGLK